MLASSHQADTLQTDTTAGGHWGHRSLETRATWSDVTGPMSAAAAHAAAWRQGAGGGELLYFMKKMFLNKQKKCWRPGKADVSPGGSAGATRGASEAAPVWGSATPV